MDLSEISTKVNHGGKCRSRHLPKNILQYREVNMKSQNVHFQVVLESHYFQTSIRNLEYLSSFKSILQKKADFKENESS